MALMAPIDIVKLKSRMFLTLTQKAEILDKLDEGISNKTLSQQYSVNKATISKIKKHRHVIKSALSNTFTSSPNRQTLKKPVHPELEQDLYKWFLQQSKCINVDGNSLRAKAQSLYKNKYQKGSDVFTASSGWLTKFKYRYGIKLLKACGEKKFNNIKSVEPVQSIFKMEMDELDLNEDEVYNRPESEIITIKKSYSYEDISSCENDNFDGSEAPENESDVSTSHGEKIPHSFVINATTKLLLYAEQNDLSFETIKVLQTMRENAVKLNIK